MFFFGASGEGFAPPVTPPPIFQSHPPGAYHQNDYPLFVDISGLGPTGTSVSYTIDGSTPTPGHGTIVSLGARIYLAAPVTLKAMCFYPGWTDSTVTSGVYSVIPQAATPTFSPVAGAYPGENYPLDVTINCSSPRVFMRYTVDGTTPTPTYGTMVGVGEAISINALFGTLTLKVIAYGLEYEPSDLASGDYSVSTVVPTPVFDPPGGTYGDLRFPLPVTITTARLPNSVIWYTLDGSTPTVGVSPHIPNEGVVNVGAGQQLKAIGTATGYTQSAMGSSGTYVREFLTDTITFTPNSSAGCCTLPVKIENPNTGSYMRYIIGNPPSNPSCSTGTLITSVSGLVHVCRDQNERITAIVCKEGYSPTPVHSSGAYVFDPNTC